MVRLLCIFCIFGVLSGCVSEVPPPPSLIGYDNYYYTTSYGSDTYSYPLDSDDSYYIKNSGIIPY